MTGDDTDASGLKVAIGFPGAVMLVVGGIVGVGVFVNPAVVTRSLHDPTLVTLAWALGGLVALLGAFVYAELAARLPKTGGDYAYLRAAYGPLPAFLYGWTLLLVVQTGGMAAVAIVFARNLDLLLGGGVSEPVIVVVSLAALAGVNLLGVASGNGVQTVLGFIKVGMIAAMVAIGFALPAHPLSALTGPLTASATASGAGRAAPLGLKAFGAGMIPVVFSYGGWQTASFVAGEMRGARRTLARALVFGVLIVIVLYLAVTLACLRALGVDALARTLTPASDLLQRALPGLGDRLAAVAVGLSALGYLSQSMLTAPRVYFAMAADGLFFPQVAALSRTSRAPAAAILIQAVWTALLALSGTYEQILSYVTAMNFLFFALSASTIFVLRRRAKNARTSDEGGFRIPLHPLTTLAFIIACLLVVGSTFWAYPINSLVGYGLLVAGVPPYLYWRRAQAQRIAAASPGAPP
ncbi:MAG: amino acid permease [Alphaproteobacteria bacterium]|jgi:APA family basic amino acid/polyamine antiporter|nr:amino acid permease [Alphaproteobacteria bacterium]